ncbi:MAG: acetyltransferase [Rickettsiales bacterium]|nr:acetyltransferase [Rickettsiales bacterium]MCA0253945.1 acetyltransferase [Pseudomonadota bacterium]
MKEKYLIIVGDGDFGQMAYDYFTYDSDYQVVGFAVERAFRKRSTLFGLPVVDFENVEDYFSPSNHEIFVAITYVQLNRPRTRLYLESKHRGYNIASYVSSKAFCWRNVTIGENTFVFEGCILQPYTKIGNNVILWSGTNIGHHSTVYDNCFFSSHVAVPGFCNIGPNCFIGVNATLADNVQIAKDCFICMGSIITKNTEENKVYKGNPAIATRVSAMEKMQVTET